MKRGKLLPWLCMIIVWCNPSFTISEDFLKSGLLYCFAKGGEFVNNNKNNSVAIIAGTVVVGTGINYLTRCVKNRENSTYYNMGYYASLAWSVLMAQRILAVVNDHPHKKFILGVPLAMMVCGEVIKNQWPESKTSKIVEQAAPLSDSVFSNLISPYLLHSYVSYLLTHKKSILLSVCCLGVGWKAGVAEGTVAGTEGEKERASERARIAADQARIAADIRFNDGIRIGVERGVKQEREKGGERGGSESDRRYNDGINVGIEMGMKLRSDDAVGRGIEKGKKLGYTAGMNAGIEMGKKLGFDEAMKNTRGVDCKYTHEARKEFVVSARDLLGDKKEAKENFKKFSLIVHTDKNPGVDTAPLQKILNRAKELLFPKPSQNVVP